LAGNPTDKFVLPTPAFNVINGGEHAGNLLAFQEFMILPTGAENFKQALRFGCEVYHNLKKVIKTKYGQNAVNVGDEGGFAPDVTDIGEVVELLTTAIENAGHTGKVFIGLDVAASEFYNAEDKTYDIFYKTDKKGQETMTGAQLGDLYADLVEKYPIISIEDPFDQDDWEAYTLLTEKIGETIQIVGDDLLVTNKVRIQTGIEKKAINALLLKVNQIGSLTESIEACQLSQQQGWGVMVSHRSGETEDSFIADLVVALATGEIKTGAPCR
jgi:enolase